MTNRQPQEKQAAFTVTYRSGAEARLPLQRDILENRFLHKLFLVTHIPAAWPAWKLGAGLLLLALGVWVAWWPAGGAAATQAALLYLLFPGSDWLLLWWLPLTGRSF